MQNPQNDGSCMAITAHNGKVLSCPSVGKHMIDDMVDMDKEAEEDCPVKTEDG